MRNKDSEQLATEQLAMSNERLLCTAPLAAFLSFFLLGEAYTV